MFRLLSSSSFRCRQRWAVRQQTSAKRWRHALSSSTLPVSERCGDSSALFRQAAVEWAMIIMAAGSFAGAIMVLGENGAVVKQKCSCEAAIGIDTDTSTPNSASSLRLKEMYDIEQVLGEGAYGMVYLARRKKDGLLVALKTLPREFTGQTDFEREVAALQLLSKEPHDHVVKLYDLHHDEKYYYLAMEWVQGGELFEHLIEYGPYSEGLAAKYVRQFAEALCFVHAKGYIHADLKPENLMLATSSENDSDMSLKVVDFGCATTHDMHRRDLRLPAEEFAAGCSFLHQVALGNQFELQRSLQARKDLVNFRDYDQRTALHIAASEGHLDICRFLVSRGAIVNRVDRFFGTPLDDAYRHGHTQVLTFLGQHGAEFGSTALLIDKFINAASQGDVEEVKALLQFGKIDLNQGDYDKRTALHLAAGEGRVQIVEMLCEAGANVNAEDRWGNRPLDDAKASEKHSNEMIHILKRYGAEKASFFPSSRRQPTSKSPLREKVEVEKVSGTAAYWPPEIFAKGAKPTPATDMWAAGVIVYLLLTGSHPFDKENNKTEEEIAETLISIGRTSKARDGEEQLNLMDELVFDERVSGLSDSCVELMKKLMHPDPEKRMASESFRRHPWVQGLTANWNTMSKTHKELEEFWQNRFRAAILKNFASSLGIDGNGEALTENDLETMFHAMDLKQNGVLELDEITSVLTGMGISETNIRRIFASADLDGSGVIHWDEFQALMSKKLARESASGSGLGLQTMYLRNRFKSHILATFDRDRAATTEQRKLREIFNAIDLEGNGVLDPHEIRVALRSVGESEDVISKIVASLDANQDGGVDWDEFQDIMGINAEEPFS